MSCVVCAQSPVFRYQACTPACSEDAGMCRSCLREDLLVRMDQFQPLTCSNRNNPDNPGGHQLSTRDLVRVLPARQLGILCWRKVLTGAGSVWRSACLLSNWVHQWTQDQEVDFHQLLLGPVRLVCSLIKLLYAVVVTGGVDSASISPTLARWLTRLVVMMWFVPEPIPMLWLFHLLNWGVTITASVWGYLNLAAAFVSVSTPLVQFGVNYLVFGVLLYAAQRVDARMGTNLWWVSRLDEYIDLVLLGNVTLVNLVVALKAACLNRPQVQKRLVGTCISLFVVLLFVFPQGLVFVWANPRTASVILVLSLVAGQATARPRATPTAERVAPDRARLRAWREYVLDENRKQDNCRLCPSCRSVVERVDGCPQMVCGQNYHGGDQQRGCGRSFDFRHAAAYQADLLSHPLYLLVRGHV